METKDKPLTLTNMAATMIKTAQSFGISREGIRTLFDPTRARKDGPLDAMLKDMGVDATSQELRVEIIRILDALESANAFDTVSAAAASCIDVGRKVGLDDTEILQAFGPATKHDKIDQGLDLWLKRTNRTYTSVDLRNEISRRLRH